MALQALQVNLVPKGQEDIKDYQECRVIWEREDYKFMHCLPLLRSSSMLVVSRDHKVCVVHKGLLDNVVKGYVYCKCKLECFA
jgi:hypothetical protein